MLTDYAKLVLHRLWCTACGLVMIVVAVMFLTGFEPHEFWGW